MRLPIFLDTDQGIDDAVAIAAAIFAPELDLQLMTTVAGNVSVEKTTRNALQLLYFWNAEIPLARGEPLCRWYAHRVMQHLCTVNREWQATTLLSTTESHWRYRRFWRFGMP